MASNYSWRCPYCQHIATITDENINNHVHYFHEGNKWNHLGFVTKITVCPNSECKEFTIDAELYHARVDSHWYIVGKPLLTWKLKPQSMARPFPEYIPRPILQDYEEACLIVSLSPKASAALSRRCLQGIIRNFWGISKPRLIDEINALPEDQVDSATRKAIDAVRSIGNIGAHMEKDINLIVDVDPDEANLLISLIESLLEEWYIRRHDREERMQRIVAAAEAKSAAKAADSS